MGFFFNIKFHWIVFFFHKLKLILKSVKHFLWYYFIIFKEHKKTVAKYYLIQIQCYMVLWKSEMC